MAERRKYFVINTGSEAVHRASCTHGPAREALNGALYEEIHRLTVQWVPLGNLCWWCCPQERGQAARREMEMAGGSNRGTR